MLAAVAGEGGDGGHGGGHRVGGPRGATAAAPPAARGAELSQSPCRGRGLRGHRDMILPWGHDPAPTSLLGTLGTTSCPRIPPWGHLLAPGSPSHPSIPPWGHSPAQHCTLGTLGTSFYPRGVLPQQYPSLGTLGTSSCPRTTPWGHPRVPGSHLGDTPVSPAQACAPAVRQGRGPVVTLRGQTGHRHHHHLSQPSTGP